MIKLLLMMKRNPNMTFEQFVDYYETKHRILGLKYNKGARRYTRRYLRPPDGGQVDSEYDVLTEIWFEDRLSFNRIMALQNERDVAAVTAEDSARLFDLTKFAVFMVEDERVDDDL